MLKSNHPPRIINNNIPQSVNSHDCLRLRMSKNLSIKHRQSTRKPSTTAETHITLPFHPNPPPQPACSGKRNRKREIIWYNPPYSNEPFSRSLTKNSPRSMRYIRSLTVTQLRSATAACPTGNRTWTDIINPFCRKRSCHLKHVTAEDHQLSALWMVIVSRNRLST